MADGQGKSLDDEDEASRAALIKTLGDSLRTAEEWQATLIDAIESISEAFGLFDANDRLILCNRRYAQTFTMHDSFEAIAHWHFTDLVRASVAKGEHIEEEFSHDVEAWVAERTRRHRDPGGSMRQIQLGDGTWLQVSERPTRSGGIVGVRTDITALKAAQHAAESASEAKTHFLRNMSHEIRTPMNGMLGMAQLLAETRLDATQRSYVAAIEQSGRHLLGIISDILDFSKVEAGMFGLESIEVDVAAILEDSGTMLAQPAQAKGLELTIDIEPDIDFAARGDPLRLQQIVINLVNNAIKFTAAGEIAITLRHRPCEEGEGRLAFDICVKDSGVGIAPEMHKKVFDDFAQADGSTARKFGGTGLGLTICRQLARLMGGDITLDSAPGRGSEFKVSLNLPRGQRMASDSPPLPTGIKALLVDDHDGNRAILARQLRGLGIEVTEAGSAEAALAALGQWKAIDLALIDMTLPDGGLDLVQTIRARLRLDSLRILMLTANETVTAEERARLALAGGLAKPVRLADLREGIRAAMADRPVAGAKVSSRSTTSLPRMSGQVLLAEDNEVNRVIVLAWLDRLGFTTRHARNGREAVEMMREHPFDLVLMDCQMPEMDGFTATGLIRQIEAERGGHTPIIALTANAVEGDRDACLKAGMDDYLTKPFKGPQLGQLIARWLPQAAVEGDEDEDAEPAIDSATLGILLQLAPTEGARLRRDMTLLYLAHAPRLIGALERDVSVARTLAEASRGVGAMALATLCEDYLANGDRATRNAITREYARVKKELTAITEEPVPGLRPR